ncbi:MAG: rhodanese-like domain-containing protein [Spirochaetes bacterium]|jgi:rhodanese-related sulfurtransferase|nr:rhodanese-like domain-containing protein [Spirochaetota bacterium]
MINLIFKLIEKIFRVERNEVIKIVWESTIIFLIAAIVGFFINMFHPKGYTFVGSEMFAGKQIVLIKSEEARIKRDGSAALFVDTRSPEEYGQEHIPGALNIPYAPDSVREKLIKENFGALGGTRELVLYCDGESCGSSSMLAKRLIEMGYSRHIYIIDNGLPEWQAKGFPLEKNGGGR